MRGKAGVSTTWPILMLATNSFTLKLLLTLSLAGLMLAAAPANSFTLKLSLCYPQFQLYNNFIPNILLKLPVADASCAVKQFYLKKYPPPPPLLLLLLRFKTLILSFACPLLQIPYFEFGIHSVSSQHSEFFFSHFLSFILHFRASIVCMMV